MTGPPPTSVPEPGAPVHRCPYCDRPFPTPHLRALHVGHVHGTAMSDAEHEAFEEANTDESDELFILHLKVVAGLVLITMGFSYLYAFVWS